MMRVCLRPESCEGSALLLTLLVVAMLAAAGSALATLTDVERLSSANLPHGLTVEYAADAALEEAIAELSGSADWNAVLAGGVRSRLFAGTSPVTTWGAILDVNSLTRDLQARTDSARPGSALTTRWQVFLTGALSAMLPDDTTATRPFVVAWVGDDLAESDGNPGADSNGVILVRARAIGPRQIRGEREAALARSDPSQAARVTVWRDGR